VCDLFNDGAVETMVYEFIMFFFHKPFLKGNNPAVSLKSKHVDDGIQVKSDTQSAGIGTCNGKTGFLEVENILVVFSVPE
jgi:hypothetical protein